jgi:hypothetical protein
MKKANLLISGLVAIIIILAVIISLLVISPMLSHKGPGTTGEIIPETPDRTISQDKAESKDSINCPTSLGIYYIIDKKNTETFTDDDIFLAIRNPDTRPYTAKLFVNGKPEGEAMLAPNSSAKTFSSTITAWWRAGSEKDTKSFPIELTIPGCSKTLSELMPALPLLSQNPNQGEEGTGGTDGNTSQKSTILDITIPPDHLPD